MSLERAQRPDHERTPEPTPQPSRERPAGKPADLNHLDRLWQAKASTPDGGQETSPADAPPQRTVGDAATADAGAASTIADSLDVVKQSFHWFNESAQRHINQLRDDLKQEDEPAWFEQVAGAVLAVALGAGAAAVGARLAAKFVPVENGITTEFVKMLWEGGIGAGISAGRAQLGGGSANNVIDPFIASQRKGISATQIGNQAQFITSGRQQIKTVAEAKKLAAACSAENVEAAGESQYVATRDAWVSYLAQTRYGAVGRDGSLTKANVNVGATTTNMSTQDRRDQINRSAPGFVPGDAPDLRDAMKGDAPGLMGVLASLPGISNHVMRGKPSVEIAFLNGVNGTIRRQYAGVPLAVMNIPRQVVTKVDGAPDFTLNLDERGQSNLLSPKQRTWLAARATVGHPENATKDEWERSREGMRLLLEELVPRSIEEPVW